MANIRLASLNASEIQVLFPYNPSLVNLIHSIPGRKWHPEEKFWSVPKTPDTINRILSTFSGHEITLSPDLEELSKQFRPDTTADKRTGLRDKRLLPRTPATDRRQKDLVDYLIRLSLFIRAGKGKKDRQTIFSEKLIILSL